MQHAIIDKPFPYAEVEERLCRAVRHFNDAERGLLTQDPNERSLTAKFAAYVQVEFAEWDVDCEYNRDGYYPKRLQLPVESVRSDDTQARTVFPDIIVHQRGHPSNLLVLEAKKAHTANGGLRDRVKLQAFLRQLEYRFGAMLTFRTRGPDLHLEPPEFVIDDGAEVH